MSIVDTAQQEIRNDLRTAAREMLTVRSTSAQVRALAQTADGFDNALWQRFSMQGWTAIEVSEDFGGDGGTFGDLSVILVEMGRRLCSNGLLASAALAAGPLLSAGANGSRCTMDPRPTGWRHPCGRSGRS